MAKSNIRREALAFQQQIHTTKTSITNDVICRWDVLKTKTTESTQRTMRIMTKNSHRKNRNSREKHRKLQNNFSISTISTSSFTSLKFSSFFSSFSMLSASQLPSSSFSLSLFKPSRSEHTFWQFAMLTSTLLLLLSSTVVSALSQHNHSTFRTMDVLKSTTPMMMTASETVASTSTPKSFSTEIPALRFSQPFTGETNNDDGFHPIIPKDINQETISENIFTKTGQYRIFEPVDSDLRATLLRKPTFSVENLKISNERSEVVTLQTKRKAALQATEEAARRVASNNEHADQKVSEKLEKSFEQTKLNQFATKRKYLEEQQNNANGKQLPSTVFNALTANNSVSLKEGLATDIKGLENLLAEYVDDFFNKGQYQPKPELIFALQQNFTEISQKYDQKMEKYIPKIENNRPVRQVVEKRIDNGDFKVNVPRALESGRLLFFAGLKKVMWPIYMGLQVLKSLMFALLLPTLIGSFGKLLGKGISSGSAPLFIRPMDEPQDLDFRDNTFTFDDDSTKYAGTDDTNFGGNIKDAGYAYNQAEASQNHNQYSYNAASINQPAFSRYGMNERQQIMQDSYLSALQSLGAASFKNSNGFSGSSSGNNGGLAGLTAPVRKKPPPPANINTFQQFQKVPASSLLLSNYDPFYSPLLSRLDSVFAQLKLNSDDEVCREKVICLMYANPAKYAPYSNLVSAQLSRELNELRKPTSDNPDILRFFKYMRAAKDGQDGIDCEKSFEKCTEFKDFENPAMVSTYHDINKLVQARKFA